MKKNIGQMDRLIRLVVGNLLILLGMLGAVPGKAAGVVFWVGVVMLVIDYFGWCPVYALLGISTLSTKNNDGGEDNK